MNSVINRVVLRKLRYIKILMIRRPTGSKQRWLVGSVDVDKGPIGGGNGNSAASLVLSDG